MADLLHNRYKLLKKCGSGGTGDVYQALDTRLKRLVALKRVRADARADRREKALRLLREAENLARVEHPNVVMVHDVIETESSVTIVMELVKGTPFKQLFQKRAIPEHEFSGYLRQLVAALEAVHAAGMIHRDVNPRNVLVSPEGVIKLTDFGLSSSLNDMDHRAGGTIGYMAPEALRKGGRIGVGLDIYGVGFLSYQALIGGPDFQKLYGTAKPLEWARWLLSREKFRTLTELGAPVSPALAAIVEKMVEKDLSDRYQKMAEVRSDLERLWGQAASPLPGLGGPSLASGMRRLIPAILARPEGRQDPGTLQP